MRVYFDENVPSAIASALRELLRGKPDSPEIFATVEVPGLGPRAEDHKIISHIAREGGILITHDKDFRREKSIMDLLRTSETKIGVFFIKTNKQQKGFWPMALLVINNWRNIQEVIQTVSTPFWYNITSSGVADCFKKKN